MTKRPSLKGPAGQIGSVLDWYHWKAYGISKYIPRHSFQKFYFLSLIFKWNLKFYSAYCPNLSNYQCLWRLRRKSGNQTLIHVPRDLKKAGGLEFTFRDRPWRRILNKDWPQSKVRWSLPTAFRVWVRICSPISQPVYRRPSKALHHKISKKDDKICQNSYSILHDLPRHW